MIAVKILDMEGRARFELAIKSALQALALDHSAIVSDYNWSGVSDSNRREHTASRFQTERSDLTELTPVMIAYANTATFTSDGLEPSTYSLENHTHQPDSNRLPEPHFTMTFNLQRFEPQVAVLA